MDLWNPLIRKAAKQFVEKKERVAVLLLARQCRELDDAPLADDLLAVALDDLPAGKERFGLTMAVVETFLANGQHQEAERALQTLLDDQDVSGRQVWRLAAKVAEAREQNGKAMEYFDRALDAEFSSLPEIINTEAVDRDYGKLLSHYQELAESMLTLKVQPPPDFLPKVIRTADRWCSLTRKPQAPCDWAAAILRKFNERDLAWDYLTTPIAMRPKESEPWVNLAESLSAAAR